MSFLESPGDARAPGRGAFWVAAARNSRSRWTTWPWPRSPRPGARARVAALGNAMGQPRTLDLSQVPQYPLSLFVECGACKTYRDEKH
jgi:hypothetical protein